MGIKKLKKLEIKKNQRFKNWNRDRKKATKQG